MSFTDQCKRDGEMAGSLTFRYNHSQDLLRNKFELKKSKNRFKVLDHDRVFLNHNSVSMQ